VTPPWIPPPSPIPNFPVFGGGGSWGGSGWTPQPALTAQQLVTMANSRPASTTFFPPARTTFFPTQQAPGAFIHTEPLPVIPSASVSGGGGPDLLKLAKAAKFLNFTPQGLASMIAWSAAGVIAKYGYRQFHHWMTANPGQYPSTPPQAPGHPWPGA
jgi:hypothetical protein